MTIAEILKKIGIEDSKISEIEKEMKENKIFTSNEENIDIRYNKLRGDHDGLTSKYAEAEKLIAELKKNSGDDLKGKITDYESKIKDLESKLLEERVSNAIKVGLLSEKATDVDYLSYQLQKEGKLELDENGSIKGWKEKIDALKKTHPNQFEVNAKKEIDTNKLLGKETDPEITKEQFNKMSYAQRLELHNSNKDLYDKLKS